MKQEEWNKLMKQAHRAFEMGGRQVKVRAFRLNDRAAHLSESRWMYMVIIPDWDSL